VNLGELLVRDGNSQRVPSVVSLKFVYISAPS